MTIPRSTHIIIPGRGKGNTFPFFTILIEN